MELVGKMLGNRYEILEKVGNGGMATVYKAKDKTLNRYVAIKVLKDEFANDQEFIKRFQIEAQSAAALSHPNIVSIYDVANDNDVHYIVMELIEGKTLKEVIKNEVKLDWKKSIEIASQIASGLSTAHKNHIIHRDIKPHNIIITKEGVAKITDFGIAKAATSSTINANSNSLRSVHYFSPEHARGGYTDEKSDIYSLGVVLYEMVTGKLPFNGDSAVSIAMKHLKDDPVEPKEYTPGIPNGLNKIILKAMKKEASSRYSTASSMYSDLQKVLKDPSTEDVGTTGSDDTIFATQRVPTINNASAIKASTINNKINTKENYGGKMNSNPNVKKKSKRRRSNPILSAIIVLLLIIAVFGLSALVGMTIFEKMMEPEANGVVPGVVGFSKDRAQEMITQAGFKMEIIGQVESNIPKDYVVQQRYSSGEKLSKGSTIGVSLSAGPKNVLVPSVVGDTSRIAQKKLEDLGLKVEFKDEESDEVEADKVIRQLPGADTTIDTGTTVTLYVSSGLKDKVFMPNLLTYTEAQALAIIKEMELVAEVNYISSDTIEDGKIVSQSVDPDEKIDIGTVVVLVINKLEPEEQEPVIIPGQDEPGKEEPTTPTKPTTPDTPAKEEYKYLTVNLSNKGARSSFVLKVVLNGDIKGRTVIHEETHKRSEGTIQIPYPADATGMIKVYVDGALDSEMLIN